jgi:N,N'-diacetyllegionaminate synthase
MSNLGEIEFAISALQSGGVARSEISILHCTTEYPAPLDEVNLLAMKVIGSAFGLDYGYSDHTLGIEVSTAAVALGASVIEKHITMDKSLPGPDHRASLEPDELKELVRAVRNVEMALGDGVKRLTKSEIQNQPLGRKSIVAIAKIKTGEIFSDSNIGVKRPGIGMSPIYWDQLIGKKSNKDYGLDEMILFSEL